MQKPSRERIKYQKNKKFLLADLILWKEISGRRIDNCRFNRQQLVEGITVDFYSAENKLIILVSPSHRGIIVQNEVLISQYFESLGYKVLRFDYDSVLNDLDTVINEIKVSSQTIYSAPDKNQPAA